MPNGTSTAVTEATRLKDVFNASLRQHLLTSNKNRRYYHPSRLSEAQTQALNLGYCLWLVR